MRVLGQLACIPVHTRSHTRQTSTHMGSHKVTHEGGFPRILVYTRADLNALLVFMLNIRMEHKMNQEH